MAISEEIKKHPYLIGGATLAAAFLLYLLLSRGSSSGSSAQSGVGSVAAIDAQNNQLEAAASVQNSQTQAQVQAAQLQANAQTAQVNAAADAQNTQTDAQLIAALAQNQTNAQANTVAGEVTNNQNSLEAGVLTSEYADELAALTNTNQTQLDAYTAGVNGAVASQQITAQQNATDINAVLGKLKLGGSTLAYNTSIDEALAEIEGESGAAVAASESQVGINNSDNSLENANNQTIANGLSNSLKTLLAAL